MKDRMSDRIINVSCGDPRSQQETVKRKHNGKMTPNDVTEIGMFRA